jgi:hypothetical protein
MGRKKTLWLILLLGAVLVTVILPQMIRYSQETRTGAAGPATIIPKPQLRLADPSTFTINAQTRIVLPDSSSAKQRAMVQKLIAYILFSTGYTLTSTPDLPTPLTNAIVVGKTTDAAVATALAPWSNWHQYQNHSEGYLFGANAQVIVVGGFDEMGMWWGIQTLREFLDQDKTTIEGSFIYDYPDIAYRAAHFRLRQDPPPAGRVTTIHQQFITDILTRLKYNEVHIFIEHNDFQWLSHPEWSNSYAVTQEEMADLVKTAKDNFIDVVPERYPVEVKLQTNPDKCAPLPSGYWTAQFATMDEQLAVFQPTSYQILLDFKGDTDYSTCGATWNQNFLSQIKKLHDHLATKGVKSSTWARGFIDFPLLDQIPKDVAMIPWYYDRNSPYAIVCNYKTHGFPAYGAPATKYDYSTTPYWKNIFDFASKVKSCQADGLVVTTWTDFTVENWQTDKGGAATNDRNYVLSRLAGLIPGGEYSWSPNQPPLPVPYDVRALVKSYLLATPAPTSAPTTPSPSVFISPTPSPSPSPSLSPSLSPSPSSSGSPQPSPSATGSPACPDAHNPACFDCNGDRSVNILDFSCFLRFYNQQYSE